MAKRKTIDDRIKDLLCEGPLVGLYFSVAVTTLKEQVDNMTDDELAKMFEYLLHPQRIRNNVAEINNKLNHPKDE